MFVCTIGNCNKRYNRKFNLKRHQNDAHVNQINFMERCLLCGQLFNTCDELQRHYHRAHKPSRQFVIKESAFKRKFVTYRYNFDQDEKDFLAAQKKLKRLVLQQVMNEAARKLIAKVSLIFIAEMFMTDNSGQTISKAVIPFRASAFFVNANNPQAAGSNIRKSFRQQERHMDEFIRSGSNWRFSRAMSFDIEIAAIKPLRGGCSTVLSHSIKNNRFLFSPTNKGNKCFLYCLAYFLIFGLAVNKTPTLKETLKLKKKVRTFDVSGVSFPISINDIKKFLRRNDRLNIKANILYRTLDEKIYPLEYGLGTGKRIINLLLVETSAGCHYMLITDVDKYLRKQYNVGRKEYQKTFFCLNCLNNFYSPQVRDKHVEICSFNKARIELTPVEGDNTIKFKNYERKHMLEYIAYLDFECVLPDSRQKCATCSSLKCKCDCSFTDEVNKQIPICYSFLILGNGNQIIHEKTFAGRNAHLHFLKHLFCQEKQWIDSLLSSNKPLIKTGQGERDFFRSKECYICGNQFGGKVLKVRDHSHYTGHYLGAACQTCNLRRRMPTRLKIFVHNCAKYDMHFIIKGLSHFKDNVRNLTVLPYNGENFRCLRFNCFEFVDTLAFLQAPLSQLTADLKLSPHTYPILKQTSLCQSNGQFNEKRFNMVLEKSFFPYEYCTSFKRMQATKSLPSISNFYSNLSEKTISNSNHNFAKSVWDTFHCKNLVDYTKLYCKIDTILLAEVFEAFRQKMHTFGGLDPAHYISLPAFGYDTMLLITKANIELPTDIDMIHFLEKGKRGGVSFINHRHLCTDKKGEVLYWDYNNLYGACLLQHLPLNQFKWLSEEEVRAFDFTQDFDGDYGYFVECDLKYPKHLHEPHSNLPLAPEILEVHYDNLSRYAQLALLQTEGSKNYKDTKLMSTFHDRLGYVLHIKNLKLYLELGLELKRVHRILKFRQDYVLKSYVEMTTAARKTSTSTFESNLFKKLVSSSNEVFSRGFYTYENKGVLYHCMRVKNYILHYI